MTQRQNALHAARLAAFDSYDNGDVLLATEAARIFEIAESTLYRELKDGELKNASYIDKNGRRVVEISATLRRFLDGYRRKRPHRRKAAKRKPSISTIVPTEFVAGPYANVTFDKASPMPVPTLFDDSPDVAEMSITDLVGLLATVSDELTKRIDRLNRLEKAAAMLTT